MQKTRKSVNMTAASERRVSNAKYGVMQIAGTKINDVRKIARASRLSFKKKQSAEKTTKAKNNATVVASIRKRQICFRFSSPFNSRIALRRNANATNAVQAMKNKKEGHGTSLAFGFQKMMAGNVAMTTQNDIGKSRRNS